MIKFIFFFINNQERDDTSHSTTKAFSFFILLSSIRFRFQKSLLLGLVSIDSRNLFWWKNPSLKSKDISLSIISKAIFLVPLTSFITVILQSVIFRFLLFKVFVSTPFFDVLSDEESLLRFFRFCLMMLSSVVKRSHLRN